MEHNREQSHDGLQSQCYNWHYNEFKDDRYLVHSNPLNSVGGVRGSINRALGSKKGRSDVEYLKAGVLYLFEFKVGRDYQKPEQKAFQEANEAEGAKYFIITSFEQYKMHVLNIRAGLYNN